MSPRSAEPLLLLDLIETSDNVRRAGAHVGFRSDSAFVVRFLALLVGSLLLGRHCLVE